MYKAVLDQNNIKLCSMYACERALLAAADLTLLTQTGAHAHTIELLAAASVYAVAKSDFGVFIENYAMQLIVETGNAASVPFNCLTAALFYFTGNSDEDGAMAVVGVLKRTHTINPAFLKKFDRALAQLGCRLKLKGNSEELVQSVMLKIDHRRFLA